MHQLLLRRLLSRQFLFEIDFQPGRGTLQRAGFDERIGGAGRHACTLRLQIEQLRVRREEHIGVERFEAHEAAALIVHDTWILRHWRETIERDRRTAEKDGGVAHAIRQHRQRP